MNIDKMPAGREMDRIIGKEVMGYTIYHYDKDHPDMCYYCLMDKEFDPVAPFDGWHTGERKTEEEAWDDCPRFSEDIAAAFELLEHIKESVKITLYEPNDTALEYACMEWYGGQWNVVLGFTPSEDERFYGEAETLPLAIGRAALKAVTKEED
jgi:hypothetical protein